MKTLLYLFLSISIVVNAQNKGMIPTKSNGETERRLALVIGNKDYKNITKLKNPINDASDMSKALEKLGFEVILKNNLSQSEFIKEIDEFGNRLQQYDVGLFYFSGHGVQYNGENYLVPIEANAKTAPEIEYNCVKLGRVLAKMEGANVKVSLAFLDACRNMPFTDGTKSLSGKGLTIPNNPPGSFVAFATRVGSTADDNTSDRNGLFTSELLHHIEVPNIGIREILDRTIKGVSFRSNKLQLPGRYDELLGDFYFVVNNQTSEVVTPTVGVAPPKSDPKPNRPPNNGTIKELPFGPKMVYVEGGSFEMGSNKGEENEKPVHTVRLESYWIGQTEVTISQYMAFCEETKSNYPDIKKGIKSLVSNNDNLPVSGVSWGNAIAYCEWLSKKTGLNYRLPTEAEWEYAARGGNKKHLTEFSGNADIKDLGWTYSNSKGRVHPVAEKMANNLGLYDMTGNVWEWCNDWFDKEYYTSSTSYNPIGPIEGTDRVSRGGSWNYPPQCCRVAYRSNFTPSSRYGSMGFRVVSP